MSKRVLACSTLPWTDDPLGAVLAQCAAAGFSHWELPIRGDGVWRGHLDPAALMADGGVATAFLSAARERPQIALLSAGFEIHRLSPLPREVDLFARCADLIAHMGARFVTVFAFDDGAAAPQARLMALSDVAARAGLELLVETHRRTATEQPTRALQLVRETGLRLTLDHSHYVSQGYDCEAFADLLPFAGLIQVRGCAPDRVEVPVEDAEQLEAAQAWISWVLAGSPPDAPVVIEAIDRTRDAWPTVVALREVLRPLLAR